MSGTDVAYGATRSCIRQATFLCSLTCSANTASALGMPPFMQSVMRFTEALPPFIAQRSKCTVSVVKVYGASGQSVRCQWSKCTVPV
eukprot:1048747-Rhodomonas_salina.1